MPHTDEEFLARARSHYQTDGEVEFDDDATIYQSESGYGAYVQAFVWVEFPDAPPLRCESAVSARLRCSQPSGHEGRHSTPEVRKEWDTDTSPTLAPQCPSVENPSGVRRGESPCRCDHAEGHGGSHICAQHALRWTQ